MIRAAPVAVAAAVLVYFALVAGRSAQDGRAPLPEYGVAASGDPSTHGPGLTLRHGADAFEIVARPASAVSDAGAKVVAYGFAIGEGEPNPIDAKVEADGAIRIRGRARALEGAREVRIVVGATGDFARYDDALAKARDGKSDAHVRVIVVPITRE